MPRAVLIASIFILATNTREAAACLITTSSSLGQQFIATTECPTWLKGKAKTLPDSNTHFAVATGTYQSLHSPTATPMPTDCGWLSLSVSACAALSNSSDAISAASTDPYPSFIVSPSSMHIQAKR